MQKLSDWLEHHNCMCISGKEQFVSVNKEETMEVEDSPKEMQKNSDWLEHHNCMPISGEEQFGVRHQEKYRTTRSETLHRRAYCLLLVVFNIIPMAITCVACIVIHMEAVSEMHVHLPCPPMWIGFGNKCFYFSEDAGNWTFSQTSCNSLEANLVQIDTEDELKFMKRYKGPYDHWIGLSRESPSHAWEWTNNPGGNIVLSC
ncbi:C-type lectin domain family 2 member D11-like isoform X2 [Sorex fumeus]|uniref:C-type lectin domain family 2 member D11-like isoform X2 n=1 Tax=Sorex fumeus TaxID=62283 RepID=UPI0024AD3D2F|nr:C-type lectin domain family 2 member D11-like isoform X2 [Sorex fumeus]